MSQKQRKQQKHGLRNHRLYGIWCNMKTRCYNTKSEKHKLYRENGITVCDEWLHDFKAFYDWCIENGYDKTLSLDRRENLEGYSPTNCRWTDFSTQAANITTLKSNNTTGFKGVCKRPNGNFQASIRFKNKRTTIGTFGTAEQAFRD